MQVEAILEAAHEVQKKGTKVLPEIMVPLVAYARELELQKDVIDTTAGEVSQEAWSQEERAEVYRWNNDRDSSRCHHRC